jgi:multidrug efflux pump subunit AcrA (membrane-fusion protein)
MQSNDCGTDLMSETQTSVGISDSAGVRRTFHDLVHEISRLSQAEIEPREFYAELLLPLVQWLQATNVAAWTPGADGRLTLESQAGISQEILFGSHQQGERHERLLNEVMARGHSLVIPAENTRFSAQQQPAAYWLVCSPVRVDSHVKAVLELIQRDNKQQDAQQEALKLLELAAEFAVTFYRNQELRRLRTRLATARRFEDFSHRLHLHTNVTETAYFIANDGRRLVDCDRLSVVLRHHGKYRVVAMSGQELVNQRANSVQQLTRLTSLVLATGEGLRFPQDASVLAPEIDETLQSYIDASQVKSLHILPLDTSDSVAGPTGVESRSDVPRQPLGALVAESFTAFQHAQDAWDRLEQVGRHSATALQNVRDLRRAGWILRMVRGRVSGRSPRARLMTLGAVGLVVLVMVLSAVLVPADFTLVAPGVLQPQQRRNVYARVDGVVRELLVTDGQRVVQGQILARLRNRELDLNLEQVLGELQTKRQTLTSIMTARLTATSNRGGDPTRANELAAQEEELRILIDSLQKQHELLKQQQSDLQVLSPIDGEIISWGLSENLAARPVQRGQRLMTVADLKGQWILELDLADRRLGHLLTAQQQWGDDLNVTFILATDPGQRHTGRIQSVAKATTIDENHGQSARVTVDLRNTQLTNPRPGAEVTAKIHCGRRALGYVWLHEVIEFVQSKLLFRL